MWKPAFTSLEHRRAMVFGWHRAFCLELRRWRGSPQQPGLMLALDRGGCCEGVVHRLPDEDHIGHIGRLVRREIGSKEGVRRIRWVTAKTANGTVQALTFWVGPWGPGLFRKATVISSCPYSRPRVWAYRFGRGLSVSYSH